jgi:hypothetical protein
MFHNIYNRPGLTGKVTSQIKSCTSHHAVIIKYKQISMKLDTHYIYTSIAIIKASQVSNTHYTYPNTSLNMAIYGVTL